MGVSGSGKSTVASMLARRLEVPFVDADGLHPPQNVAKMAAGIPLTDRDRGPWLDRVGEELGGAPDGVVVACSALRLSYRAVLRGHAVEAAFIHLHGTRAQLTTRLTARLDHFMPPALLDTQLATLEPLQVEESGVVLDIASSPDRIAADAAAWVWSRHAPVGAISVDLSVGGSSGRSTGSVGARRRSDVKAGTSAS
jgi:carbohydrate kinase (thermoresistant glucokinase family)